MPNATVIHRDGTFTVGGRTYQAIQGGPGWGYEIVTYPELRPVEDGFFTLGEVRDYADRTLRSLVDEGDMAAPEHSLADDIRWSADFIRRELPAAPSALERAERLEKGAAEVERLREDYAEASAVAEAMSTEVERTLAEVRSLIAAVEDPNDIGPHGNGYRNAVAEVRRQLDLRFGKAPDA